MNDNLMKLLGFENEVKLVKQKICPLCCEPINMEDFNDELSKKEYFISGICQKCQDESFE